MVLGARLALQTLSVHAVLSKTCSLRKPQKDFEEGVVGQKLSLSARVAVGGFFIEPQSNSGSTLFREGCGRFRTCGVSLGVSDNVDRDWLAALS